MGRIARVDLKPVEREELEKIVARPTAEAGQVRRARVILLSNGKLTGAAIAERLDLTPEAVSCIRRRFRAEGIAGLTTKPKAGRKDHAVPADEVERIIQMAMSPPPPGRSRWTTRLLAKEFGRSSRCISGILSRNGLKPHLSRTYKVSKDPEFAAKVHDVVGLYLKPPEHAIVLSVDEKTQIQALERTQLPLPLRKGRARRHTHDYKRNGVVDLYAALEIATGRVTHELTDSHTAMDFISFMNKVVKAHPHRELHIILDNSSTHKTADVGEWLRRHSHVHFHFTPTSASWLNQVEGFFGILGKQSLSENDFPSKKALRAHIEAYMRSWNQNPTPFEWTKPAEAIIKSHKRMLESISNALH